MRAAASVLKTNSKYECYVARWHAHTQQLASENSTASYSLPKKGAHMHNGMLVKNLQVADDQLGHSGFLFFAAEVTTSIFEKLRGATHKKKFGHQKIVLVQCTFFVAGILKM